MLHSTFAWFNDDFTSYEVAPVQVYMPDAVTTKTTGHWPIFERGNILQLDNGDLLAPMYGVFKGDRKSRVILSRSSDRGHTWRYHATMLPLRPEQGTRTLRCQDNTTARASRPLRCCPMDR